MPEKSLKSKSMRNPPIRVGGTPPCANKKRHRRAPPYGPPEKAKVIISQMAGPSFSNGHKKKPVGTSLQVSILSVSIADYSATGASVAAESVATAALSATVLSAATLSTTALSTAAESTASVLAVLLPQEAKEIAARATNMKTNFFILSLILNVKQSIAFIKTMQRYELFPYGVCLYPTFFQ